jgi:1,4-alpha-glucan branching enzyme
MDRVGCLAQTRMWWAINATGRPMPMLFMGDEFLQGGFWHCGDNRDEWMQWPLDISRDGAMVAAQAAPALEGDSVVRLQVRATPSEAPRVTQRGSSRHPR